MSTAALGAPSAACWIEYGLLCSQSTLAPALLPLLSLVWIEQASTMRRPTSMLALLLRVVTVPAACAMDVHVNRTRVSAFNRFSFIIVSHQYSDAIIEEVEKACKWGKYRPDDVGNATGFGFAALATISQGFPNEIIDSKEKLSNSLAGFIDSNRLLTMLDVSL